MNQPSYSVETLNWKQMNHSKMEPIIRIVDEKNYNNENEWKTYSISQFQVKIFWKKYSLNTAY